MFNQTITIRLKIKSIYQNLSQTEKKMADFILENPKETSRSTINEISQQLDIADSTFFQFTRKLGFTGFKEFKIALLTEEFDSSISIHEKITHKDDSLVMIHKVFDTTIQALQDTKKLVSQTDYTETAKIFTQSNVVGLFGIGGSNVIAADMYHKFLRSPVNCRYASDYHMQLMHASLLTENDCAFLISHTGITAETLELAEVAKKAGAKVIVMTSYSLSAITKLADITLLSTSEETAFRTEALSSRISQLAIIDALFVLVMFTNENQANIALKKIRTAIARRKNTG